MFDVLYQVIFVLVRAIYKRCRWFFCVSQVTSPEDETIALEWLFAKITTLCFGTASRAASGELQCVHCKTGAR